MLILLIKLQDLQNTRTRLLQGLAEAGFGTFGAIGAAEGIQGLIKPGEHATFPIQQLGIGGTPVLLQETVLFQRKLVQLVTELLVLRKGFHRAHGCGWGEGFAGEAGAGVSGGVGAVCWPVVVEKNTDS